MATPAGRLIQDQNLSIHSIGAPLGRKVDANKPAKKGAVGGRRALNDISNSGKPSALQPSTKHNSINVVSAGKTVYSKAPEKGKAGGRKALSDLTNSAKPSANHLSKKSQDKKSSAIAAENIPSAIKEESFLHNHQECIKAQRIVTSFECFLDTIGLDKGSSLVQPESLELKPESPVQCLEIEEEMPVVLNEDKVPNCWEAEFLDCSSPISVKPTYENWNDESFLGFKLIDTPKLLKY
ncbi:hypothetical protein ACH5RR_017144 [Cinchona calisaya]|uniref:Uncharacterized protein n=1 Tax=Cinchona calisaya TaxID=153742 RepID=A0ABD3A1B5_9GENT